MKKLALLLLLISGAANAESMTYGERLKMLQQNQHTRPDAAGYVNKMVYSGQESVSFQAGERGHFYLPVIIDGKELEMMADTGASSIFISQSDAHKLGVNISNLHYNIPFETANGRVFAAETFVKSISVGNIQLQNVPIIISQNRNNDMSLLGMEFFRRLTKYDVNNGVLTLYK